MQTIKTSSSPIDDFKESTETRRLSQRRCFLLREPAAFDGQERTRRPARGHFITQTAHQRAASPRRRHVTGSSVNRSWNTGSTVHSLVPGQSPPPSIRDSLPSPSDARCEYLRHCYACRPLSIIQLTG